MSLRDLEGRGLGSVVVVEEEEEEVVSMIGGAWVWGNGTSIKAVLKLG